MEAGGEGNGCSHRLQPSTFVYLSKSLSRSPFPPHSLTYASRCTNHSEQTGCSDLLVWMIVLQHGSIPTLTATSIAFCMPIITVISVFSSLTSTLRAFCIRCSAMQRLG